VRWIHSISLHERWTSEKLRRVGSETINVVVRRGRLSLISGLNTYSGKTRMDEVSEMKWKRTCCNLNHVDQYSKADMRKHEHMIP
jgi:hypothetical protein